MTRTGRVALAVVTNYAATAVVAVAGFALVPFVLRFVGRDEYGLWLTLGQAFAYFNLLDFGVGSALIRRTAQLGAAPESSPAVRRALSTAVVTFSGLGLVVVAAGVAFGIALPRLIDLSPRQVTMARWLLAVMIGYTAVAFPLRAALKTLHGLQQMATAHLLAMLEGIVMPALAITFLAGGLGLVSLPLASAAAGLLAGGMAFTLLYRRQPPLRVSLSDVSRDEAGELFRWSALLWLNSLAVMVIYQTDNLVVASGQGLEAAAVYGLTTRLPLYALPMIVVLADSCVPGAVELVAQGRIDRLREVFLGVLRATGAAAVGAALVAAIINARFVSLWVGGANYGGTWLTACAGGILVFRVLMQTASVVVLGVGRIRGVVVLSLCEAALNLALSLWWVRRFGSTGVAAATLIAGLFTSGWFVTWLTSRLIAVPALRLVWLGLLLPMACGVPAVLTALTLQAHLQHAGWIELAMLTGLVGGVYGGTFILAGASRSERLAWWQRLRWRYGTAAPLAAPDVPIPSARDASQPAAGGAPLSRRYEGP